MGDSKCKKFPLARQCIQLIDRLDEYCRRRTLFSHCLRIGIRPPALRPLPSAPKFARQTDNIATTHGWLGQQNPEKMARTRVILGGGHHYVTHIN